MKAKRKTAVQKYLSEIGKLGGSATGGAKAIAARRNGKKGGRKKNEIGD